MKSRHSETGGDFLYYKKCGRQVVAGNRLTGSDGAVEGGRVRGDGLLAGSTSGVA